MTDLTLAERVWINEGKKIHNVISSDFLNLLDNLLDDQDEELAIKDDEFACGEIYKLASMHKFLDKKFRKELLSNLDRSELIDLSEKLEVFDIQKKNSSEIIHKILEIDPTNSLFKVLADFFELPDFIFDILTSEMETIPSVVDPYFADGNFYAKGPFKSLKKYQLSSFINMVEALKYPHSRCILNMPTGTGKTRTAMELVSYFLRSENFNANKVLWVADNQEILDQAKTDFLYTWNIIGDSPVSLVSLYSKNRDLIPNSKALILVNFQSLNSYIKCLNNIDLIVIDEAHRSMATKWFGYLEDIILSNKNVRVCGLTATPIRTDLSETDRLIGFFQQLVPIDTKPGLKIFDYFISKGIMSEPEYFQIKGCKPEGKFSSDKEIPKKVIDFIAKEGSRNYSIVTNLKKILGSPSERKQMLYFGTSVGQSLMISVWLLKHGYNAFHIDANTNPNTRRAAVEAFKLGKIDILCNYNLLTTGFDAPSVSKLFIARVTTSPIIYSQMIGRVLRGPKVGGTDKCQIYEMVDEFTGISVEERISFDNYVKIWDHYEDGEVD